MYVADKDHILNLFSPYHHTIVESIRTAWDEYRELLREKPILFPRTRANIVWDWAATYTKQALAGTEVRTLDVNQTTWFYLNQYTMFRIKKSDKAGFTRNYPTQSAIDYYGSPTALDGIQPAVRLDVGYVLDPPETGIQDIRVVYRNGKRIEWQYSIYDEIANVADLVVEKPKVPEKSKVAAKVSPDVKHRDTKGVKK